MTKHIPTVGPIRIVRLLIREMHEELFQWMALSRDIVRLRLFKDIYIIHSHILARDILQNAQKDVFKGDFLSQRLARVFGNGLLTSDNPQWLEHRRIMQPAFHKERIMRMMGDLQELIAERLNVWSEERTQEGRLVDIEGRLRSLTMECIGHSIGFRTNDRIAPLLEIMESGARLISGSMPVDFPEWVPFTSMHRLRKLDRALEWNIEQVILQNAEDRPSDSLLSLLEEGILADDPREKHRMIMDEIKTVLISGIFTISDALLWSIYAIERHPEKKAKLLIELEQGRGRTYLQACLNESMRWSPAVWSVWYKAREDLRLDGYLIPRNAVILINLYNIFRNPDWVTDPDDFIPERFLLPDPPAYFIPYGQGPRKCIGANLSHSFMLAFLEQFYSTFEVVLSDEKISGRVRITHCPKKPLRVKLIPRLA